MDLSSPTAALLQGGTSAVLGVLAGTSAGLTGRTVARLAGLSHAGAGKVLTQLGAAVAAWPVPCAGCALFGSAARRDGATRSDLDVLVLRPDHLAVDDPSWRAQLDDTASQAHRWTGNPLSWVEFDTATVTRMITTADPLIGELRRDAHWLIEPTPPIRTALSTAARSA